MKAEVQTKDDALSLLRTILVGAQKARSIGFETTGETEDFLATLQPWLYGKNSLVPKLAEAISRYEKPGAVIPGGELFNFLYIATRAEPAIGIAMVNYHDRWASVETDYRWMAQTFTDQPLYAEEGAVDPQGSPL